MYDITAMDAAAVNDKCQSSRRKSTAASEYQLSINRQINDIITQNTDREDMIWVSLSDECLARMQQDPAYESWVLDKVRQACGSCKGDRYESWIVLKFGASESDFQETGRTIPDRRTRERLRQQEIEAKKALKEKRKKQLEKKLLEEKWRKQKVERDYVMLKILDHRMQVEEENKAMRCGLDYHPQDHTASLYAAAKRRARAYESTFLYCDCP